MASNRFLNQLEDTDLLLLEIPYKDTPLTVKDFKELMKTNPNYKNAVPRLALVNFAQLSIKRYIEDYAEEVNAYIGWDKEVLEDMTEQEKEVISNYFERVVQKFPLFEWGRRIDTTGS